MARRFCVLFSLGLAASLGACAGGPVPEIATPTPDLPPAFFYAPDGSEEAALAALLPSGDPAFTNLVEAAIAQSPSLAEALARIEAARAQAARASAERLPSVSADGSIVRNRINPAQFGEAGEQGFIPEVQTSYGANLNARWDPDIFGELRARERAALARIDAASASAAAVRIALITEIAASVIDFRVLEARTAALQEDVSAAGELARLATVREEAGIAPGFDRVRAEATASASRSRLAGLDSERVRIIGRLVTLTTQDAASVSAALRQNVSARPLDPAPAALPSQLLVNRPDVIAAAATLAATDQDLAATARSRFPRLSLSAVLGLLAFQPENFFNSDSFVSTLAASVAGPLFDFGRIEAEIDSAAADKRIAFQAYRAAVFEALGDAEAAYGLIAAADNEASLAAEERDRLQRAAALANDRFRAGLANFLEVLEARRAADASGERAAAARGRARRARVLLWQALGGDAPVDREETAAMQRAP
ncbi:MAG: efflux transporter outer membrane subunit [Erythrobacter sp.]|jgi:multidrug efflux system outer membrane protein|nr:efflux transporter outer membrane subunit [Erythrobacter sp.]